MEFGCLTIFIAVNHQDDLFPDRCQNLDRHLPTGRRVPPGKLSPSSFVVFFPSRSYIFVRSFISLVIKCGFFFVPFNIGQCRDRGPGPSPGLGLCQNLLPRYNELHYSIVLETINLCYRQKTKQRNLKHLNALSPFSLRCAKAVSDLV